MLEKCDKEVVGPRNFHDRHGWVLKSDNSILQERLNQIREYADKLDMKVNIKKTKVLPFNFSKKYDFVPNLEFDGNLLEVEYQSKLLGVMIDSSGSWRAHIEYIAMKANRRVFFLKRLKRLGASQETLKLIYILFIRSILEFAAPVWTGALTGNKKLTNKLNKVHVCLSVDKT